MGVVSNMSRVIWSVQVSHRISLLALPSLCMCCSVHADNPDHDHEMDLSVFIREFEVLMSWYQLAKMTQEDWLLYKLV